MNTSSVMPLFIKAISYGLKKIGFFFVKKKTGYHYVSNIYGITHHKHIDIRDVPIFGDIAKEVVASGLSGHYYDRLYILYQGVVAACSLRVREEEMLCFAEVGVYRGGTSFFISRILEVLKMGNSHLYGFDTFEGHSEKDIRRDLDAGHIGGSFSETDFGVVSELLSRFSNVSLFKGRFQQTCDQVKDKIFHFVHLDVDIYEPMRMALDFFSERLVVGGVMIVDDYGFRSCPGVEKAVKEFLSLRPNFFSLHVLSGQCVILKHSIGIPYR